MTHRIVVADEGPLGESTWRARCECGWETQLLTEDEADVFGYAHAHGLCTREDVVRLLVLFARKGLWPATERAVRDWLDGVMPR